MKTSSNPFVTLSSSPPQFVRCRDVRDIIAVERSHGMGPRVIVKVDDYRHVVDCDSNEQAAELALKIKAACEAQEPVTSSECLAAILVVSDMFSEGRYEEVEQEAAVASLPAAKALGDSPRGWRCDRMLRACYKALSPEHRELVDGDSLVFEHTFWQVMVGEIQSL